MEEIKVVKARHPNELFKEAKESRMRPVAEKKAKPIETLPTESANGRLRMARNLINKRY